MATRRRHTPLTLLTPLILLLLLLLLLPTPTSALLIRGEKLNKASWKYLEKFAFVPQQDLNRKGDDDTIRAYSGYGHGVAKIEVWHSNHNDSLWILGYSFNAVSKYRDKLESVPASKLSCADRIVKAPIRILARVNASTPALGTVLPDGTKSKFAYKFSTTITITRDLLGTASPQMVYWALANCKTADTCTPSRPAVTNTRSSPYYPSTELSFDEWGNDKLTIFFLVSQVLLCLYGVYLYRMMLLRRRLSPTAKLLLAVLPLYLLRYIFLCAYYTHYSSQGFAVSGVLASSNCFNFIAQTLLIATLCGLAGGWTVYRRKLKMLARIRLTLLLTWYPVLMLVSVVWLVINNSSGDTVFVYGTPPGIFALVVLVIAWLRLLQYGRRSMLLHPELGSFFVRLRNVGTVYIMCRPLTALICLGVFELYQMKVFLTVDLLVSFLTQLVLLIMYDPNFFPKLFPQQDDYTSVRLTPHESELAGLNAIGSGAAAASKASSTAGTTGIAGGTAYARLPQGSGNTVAYQQPIKIISFTGGASVGQLYPDANGKYRLPSSFDRQQLASLREVSCEVKRHVEILNDYTSSLWGVMSKLSLEEGAAYEALIEGEESDGKEPIAEVGGSAAVIESSFLHQLQQGQGQGQYYSAGRVSFASTIINRTGTANRSGGAKSSVIRPDADNNDDDLFETSSTAEPCTYLAPEPLQDLGLGDFKLASENAIVNSRLGVVSNQASHGSPRSSSPTLLGAGGQIPGVNYHAYVYRGIGDEEMAERDVADDDLAVERAQYRDRANLSRGNSLASLSPGGEHGNESKSPSGRTSPFSPPPKPRRLDATTASASSGAGAAAKGEGEGQGEGGKEGEGQEEEEVIPMQVRAKGKKR